jgi:hypothetical protein
LSTILHFLNQLENTELLSTDEENQLFRRMGNYDFFKIKNGKEKGESSHPITHYSRPSFDKKFLKQTNKDDREFSSLSFSYSFGWK